MESFCNEQREVKMLERNTHVLAAVIVASIAAWSGITISATDQERLPRQSDDRMSGMGHAAARARAAVAGLPGVGVAKNADDAGVCVDQPDCPGADDAPPPDGPASTQSETTIAVDSTGQHVVVGFNDFRGFNLNPISVSGFMYSDDGGVTFVDGGQLPSPGADMIGTTKLPQVFGDPDIKYLGKCTFVYSSIIVKKFSSTTAVQTLGVHRSTDCGHTWVGPFEVTAATNPHGLLACGIACDAADKEFIDVDPDTGRVLMSWSNFTPASTSGVEISTTYSDNFTTATPPTWSPRRIVAATAVDGQGSIPRFAGRGSHDAYIAWSRFPGGLTNNIGFARSDDDGATWSAPMDLAAPFFTMDQVLGNDRVHNFPSMAVDKSHSRFRGDIYVVYAANNNQDGADIAFQRSTDEGLTFSAPLLLNSRPGHDRAQWFPTIAVDSATGRIDVFYNDQGIASSGDLSEFTHTSSNDGGRTWKAPQPITSRPFHAGWGNDTGQPNLGDYNQAVAQNGDAFVTYALASRPPAGFADGQPTSASLTVPDVAFKRLHNGRRDDDDGEDEGEDRSGAPTLNIAGVTVTERHGNGYINPGDIVKLKIALRNYVTNPLNAHVVHDVDAVLATFTPGVSIGDSRGEYEKIRPGETEVNKESFVLHISPAFAPGTPIELALRVGGEEHGHATLLHTLFTGTPKVTTLLNENFDEVTAGTLPPGWTASHAGGANIVPWKTSSTFCNTTSNAAFHPNAADGPGPGPFTNARFERLFSPMFIVPGDSDYVTIDMDVCYDTEDDPAFNIQAFDGFLLRVTDFTSGRLLRSVLVEAFEDEFTTGSFFHYPKHFPRSGNSAYFQDMSAWAGYSNGFQHVRMRLPGMAGSTAQLRFEYTQDEFGICSDVRPGHSCGVSFDNLVVNSVKSVVP
jgi:hypothetical protein